MTEKMKADEDENLSISEMILKGLTGKVAEMGSAQKENTEQVKKVLEATSRLPAAEKQLESLADRVWKMENRIEKNAKDSKDANDNQGKRLDALASAISMPAGEIGALRQELVNHARLFEKPMHKEVHYRHFLGWPILVVVLAVVGALWMFVLWQGARYKLAAKVENDIKYRYMKLSGDSVIAVRVNAAEEAWRVDPDQFRKTVETDEELIWENTANYLRKERLDSERRELRNPKGR